MEIKGNEGSLMSYSQGVSWINNFTKANPNSKLNSVTYGIETIKSIMEAPGAVGIRVYNAVNDKGEPTFVLMAVDKNGDGIQQNSTMDIGLNCPPFCGRP